MLPIEQKHFIQALYDSFPDPVIVVDSQKIIQSANEAMSKQFDYVLDEILGKSARVIYASDEDYDLCMRSSQKLSAEIDFSEGVYRYRRKDGSVFSARLRVTVIKDDDGALCGFIGVVHDISDFLNLDLERRKASDIFNTALQAMPEGFAIFDRNERLLVYNDAYQRICAEAGFSLRVGATAQEILASVNDRDDYPPASPEMRDDSAWIAKRMEDFRNPGGKAHVFSYGNGRWLRAENLKAGDGNTVALRIDITELKETELALERQRLEYYTLLQNIPDFITRISKDLHYTFVNERYSDFIGCKADDLIGQPFLNFVPEGDREMLKCFLDRLSPETPMASREQHRQLADGSDFWIFWSNMAIFDNGNLAEYITVGRDITELKAQQTQIAQQSAELQRKNDALNQFTGTVSHDLKAPLRHISMFSEMISEDVENGLVDELPVYARHLRQSARRMDHLIDSLLDYAQIADQISQWQTVNLKDVISEAMSILASFVRESGASFEFDALPQVKGDPELLKRLCQNVIGNAIKYRREGLKPVIRIFCEKSDGVVRIYFQDNGIGVDPRFSRKIFDVFQRLHRDETTFAGTGIGLALAKRIAESHNGAIELDTTFSQGARFILTLPDVI